MALDLTRPLPEPDPLQGLRLVRTRDLGLLREMVEIFAPGVHMPPHQGRQAYRTLLTEQGEPDRFYRHHVGLRQGRVACSASYFRMGSVIGLDYVSTAPDHRRKGYARAVLLSALGDAVREGCTMAVLQATEMGRPLYLSLGFRELGTTTLWSDSPEKEDKPT